MPATAPLSMDCTVVATKDQVSSPLGGETVVLDMKGGVYHGLNATGARVWTLVQEPRKVSEIRDVLLNEYDVEPARCEADLLALLEQLAGKGLIEVRRSALA